MSNKYLPNRESTWLTVFIWMLLPVVFLIFVLIWMPVLILPAAICLGVGLIACFLGILFNGYGAGIGLLWLCAFIIFIWMFCV